MSHTCLYLPGSKALSQFFVLTDHAHFIIHFQTLTFCLPMSSADNVCKTFFHAAAANAALSVNSFMGAKMKFTPVKYN